MLEQCILQSRDGGVLTLTLHRPSALNSFTAVMHEQLLSALHDAAVDPSVRCVVLTGAGRGFCTGQDLADLGADKAASSRPTDLGQLLTRFYHPLVMCLRTMPVPVVAAVNGVAAGAGASLALACDLVIATASASFIFPFTKVGLVPDSGAPWLLPRQIGRARTMGLVMLGDKVSAQDARQMGMIWGVAEDASFAMTVAETACRLASMSTTALVATRSLIDRAGELDFASSLMREAEAQHLRGLSADYKEGLAAFKAKRAPQFGER